MLICAVEGPNRYKPCLLAWSVFSKNDQKYVKYCQTDFVINLTNPDGDMTEAIFFNL